MKNWVNCKELLPSNVEDNLQRSLIRYHSTYLRVCIKNVQRLTSELYQQ
jgi:hypothetical protein